MIIKQRKINGIFEIVLSPLQDHRGFFMRTYDQRLFAQHGLNLDWVQDNQSYSKKKGTVRGLHFQFPPHGEIKLIRVLLGEIFFVFVDLRKNSPTFGQWDHLVLSSKKNQMVYLPKGFALGSCTLTDHSTILYKMGHYYVPESCGTIQWNDPDLAIDWPVKKAILSSRDAKAQSFKAFSKKWGGLE